MVAMKAWCPEPDELEPETKQALDAVADEVAKEVQERTSKALGEMPVCFELTAEGLKAIGQDKEA